MRSLVSYIQTREGKAAVTLFSLKRDRMSGGAPVARVGLRVVLQHRWGNCSGLETLEKN